MKRLFGRWNIMKHCVLSLIVLLLIGTGMIAYEKLKVPSAIGVIGGGDGPTEVVRCYGGSVFPFVLICIVLFVIMLVSYKPIKRIFEKAK